MTRQWAKLALKRRLAIARYFTSAMNTPKGGRTIEESDIGLYENPVPDIPGCIPGCSASGASSNGAALEPEKILCGRKL
jgi:hypothetical protein